MEICGTCQCALDVETNNWVFELIENITGYIYT